MEPKGKQQKRRLLILSPPQKTLCNFSFTALNLNVTWEISRMILVSTWHNAVTIQILQKGSTHKGLSTTVPFHWTTTTLEEIYMKEGLSDVGWQHRTVIPERRQWSPVFWLLQVTAWKQVPDYRTRTGNPSTTQRSQWVEGQRSEFESRGKTKICRAEYQRGLDSTEGSEVHNEESILWLNNMCTHWLKLHHAGE